MRPTLLPMLEFVVHLWTVDQDCPRRGSMIRHYTAMGLQLLGLILTGEALLIYFGDMGGLMKAASVGAGIFYAGWIIRPRTGGQS